MAMTIESVPQGLRNNADDLDRNKLLPILAGRLRAMADAIDANITQPAQAVDVEKVREVIEQTREYYERTDDRRTAYALENVLSDIYENLTAALPNANGKEG